jgi:hypothetical protein
LLINNQDLPPLRPKLKHLSSAILLPEKSIKEEEEEEVGLQLTWMG